MQLQLTFLVTHRNIEKVNIFFQHQHYWRTYVKTSEQACDKNAYIPFTFIQKAPLVIFVVFCSFFLNLNAFVQLTSQVNAKKLKNQ